MTEKKDGPFVTLMKKAVGMPTSQSSCCGTTAAPESACCDTTANQSTCCSTSAPKDGQVNSGACC